MCFAFCCIFFVTIIFSWYKFSYQYKEYICTKQKIIRIQIRWCQWRDMEVKYLRVILYPRLTSNRNLDSIRRKAECLCRPYAPTENMRAETRHDSWFGEQATIVNKLSKLVWEKPELWEQQHHELWWLCWISLLYIFQ